MLYLEESFLWKHQRVASTFKYLKVIIELFSTELVSLLQYLELFQQEFKY